MDRWTLIDLVQALDRILAQDMFLAKFCLLIDGLDEFDESSDDHTEIARSLKSWASAPSIKICVSTRPLIPFENAFEECPSLMLQNLTCNDIRMFINKKFGEDRKFRQLKCEEPKQAPVLEEEIVQKASGVFLWVKLVVSSLLSGLGNGDSISGLKKRLQLLPTDLKELYKHMFLGFDRFYLHQTVQLFDVVFESGRLRWAMKLSPIELSYAEEDDDFVLRHDLEHLDHLVIFARYRRMDRRLKSRSKGLLEIQGGSFVEDTPICQRTLDPTQDCVCVQLLDSKVEYLHKTVEEFLADPDIWGILAGYKDPSADPLRCLLRICLIKLKIYPWSKEGTFKSRILIEAIADCCECACRLENAGTGAPARLLQHLDQTIWSYSTAKWINPEGLPPLLFVFGFRSLEDTVDEYQIRIIEYVLQRGSDPNEVFAGWTIWQHVLNRMLGTEIQEFYETLWESRVELLLRHGADPEAPCKSNPGIEYPQLETPSTAIKKAFSGYPPSEARLQILLKEKIAEKHARLLASAPKSSKRKRRKKTRQEGSKRLKTDAFPREVR